MTPEIVILGRSWNGSYLGEYYLSRDDHSGFRLPVLAVDSTEFFPDENRFRMPFLSYKMAEIERNAVSKIPSDDTNLYSYNIKWTSCRRLIKTFSKVAEILPHDFGVLSVSVQNILVINQAIARNIIELRTEEFLNGVLNGSAF